VLQHATQQAATAVATTRSDSWLAYNERTFSYKWENEASGNVYTELFMSFFDTEADMADAIVRKLDDKYMLNLPASDLTVAYGMTNYLVYKEVTVTATRVIPSPIDLSFVGFPAELPITVTSTAVVQNGDEFVRNIDMVTGFVVYLDEKYQISSSSFAQGVGAAFQKVTEFLRIN